MTESYAPTNAPTKSVAADDRAALNESGRFHQNATALVIGRFAIAAAGWLGTVLIARQLTEVQFGQFTLVFSILGMLAIVTELGVGRIAVAAMLGSDEDRAVFAGSYILLRTALGAAGYVFAVMVALFGGYEAPVPLAVAVGGVIVLVSTPSHAYEIAFQVRDRLTPLAVAHALGKLAQLALTVAIFLRGGSVILFIIPAVLADVLILVWKMPAAHRMAEIRYKLDLGIWWLLLKEAVPLSLGAAFVMLYYRIDSVMLSKLDTFEAVGQYGIAYKFVDLVHFVPIAIGTALVAPLTAAWPDRPDQFHRRIDDSLRMMALAGGAALVGMWLFAADVIGLLYTDTYRPAGRAAAVVITGEVLAFVSMVAITALISIGRHRRYPFITLSGLILNLALNAALIPRFSYEGAALTTLITEFVVVTLLWFQARSIDGWVEAKHHRSFAFLLVAVPAGLIVGYGLNQVVPWMVAAGAAVVVYTAVAYGIERSRGHALRMPT